MSDDTWLNTKQVSELLNVTQMRVREWSTAGAPHERRGRSIVFDGMLLREWLIQNGKVNQGEAARPEICRKRKDIAARFGVRTRTIAEWLQDPSFPGRSGTRGRHGEDGYFPVVIIAKWLIETGRKTQIPAEVMRVVEAESNGLSVHQQRERYSKTRADLLELDLKERQGQLIDADEVIRYAKRCCSYAVTAFTGIPAKVVATVPERFTDEDKKLLFGLLTEYIQHGMHHMHELLESDVDDVEVKDDTP